MGGPGGGQRVHDMCVNAIKVLYFFSRPFISNACIISTDTVILIRYVHPDHRPKHRPFRLP